MDADDDEGDDDDDDDDDGGAYTPHIHDVQLDDMDGCKACVCKEKDLRLPRSKERDIRSSYPLQQLQL